VSGLTILIEKEGGDPENEDLCNSLAVKKPAVVLPLRMEGEVKGSKSA